MLKKSLFFLLVIMLGFGIILLISANYLPFSSTGRQQKQISYLMNDGRKMVFNVLLPNQMRSGFEDVVNIEAGFLQDSGQNDLRDNGFQSINFIFQLIIANMDVEPVGDIQTTFTQNDQKTLAWVLRSNVIENLEGTLWIYLEDEGNALEHIPIYAIPITIQNLGVFNFTFKQIQNLGFFLTLMASLLFFLLILLKLYWKKIIHRN